jgi:uncharacterized protein YqeY
MSLQTRIDEDLKAAMKAGDEARKLALRSIKTAIIRAQKQEDNRPLSDEEILAVLRKEAKQRRESITAFEQGGRPDLAARERAELAVIESYLPAQLDAEAIRQQAQAVIAEVGATGPRDMGKVMGRLMPLLAGKADGRLVNQIVRELLGVAS